MKKDFTIYYVKDGDSVYETHIGTLETLTEKIEALVSTYGKSNIDSFGLVHSIEHKYEGTFSIIAWMENSPLIKLTGYKPVIK